MKFIFSSYPYCLILFLSKCSPPFLYSLHSLFSFKFPVLAAAPDKHQIPQKSRNPQNFQFPFTKAFEYKILFFPSEILKTTGEREYKFFKNPIFPQKLPGIPKHSRFQLPAPLEVRKAREIPFL